MDRIYEAHQYERLIREFSTFVADRVIETHERSFNQRREQWESTVDVLVENSVNNQLNRAIRSTLTPVLVRQLRQSVASHLQQDLEPKLAASIATALTEAIGENLASELAAGIAMQLQSQLQQIVEREVTRQNSSSVLPLLKQISDRQLQSTSQLKRISWLLAALTGSCLVFGASHFLNHYFPQVLPAEFHRFSPACFSAK